jgi:hypothetical protein
MDKTIVSKYPGTREREYCMSAYLERYDYHSNLMNFVTSCLLVNL